MGFGLSLWLSFFVVAVLVLIALFGVGTVKLNFLLLFFLRISVHSFIAMSFGIASNSLAITLHL